MHLHDIIVQATGNKRLMVLINQLAEQMYRYRFEYIKDLEQHKVLVEEHAAIFDAISSRNRDAAKEAARIHIDNQEKAVMRQIREETTARERYGQKRI